MKSIIDTPEEYRLRILAEECTELAQAALKLIRANERDTPVSEIDARMNMIEECADVYVCVRSLALSEFQLDWIKKTADIKLARWEQRLNNAKVL